MVQSSTKVRVLACGRSGTLYTTHVLQEAGLKVGHEWTDENGTVSCVAYGNPPYPLFPWEPPKGRVAHQGEDIMNTPWSVTLHQVRHPLKVIESAYIVLPAASWKFYSRHIPVVRLMPKLYRCMLYWLKWNELCEKQALFTYQVEKIKQEWPRIAQACGLPEKTPFPEQVSQKTNSEKRRQIPFVDRNFKIEGWETLEAIDPILTKRIKQKATIYGY